MATKGKDLRSGRSVWQPRSACGAGPLSHDIKTDVLVLGAGIAGAAIADAIASADIIAGEIIGRPDVDADLYRFSARNNRL